MFRLWKIPHALFSGLQVGATLGWIVYTLVGGGLPTFELGLRWIRGGWGRDFSLD